MQCKAVQVVAPNKWQYDEYDIRDSVGEAVELCYSSICGTDRSVIDGSLIYYQNGYATYPIITGHEWCGIYQNQPVVGICIIGCGYCVKCIRNSPMHCDARREVGVVNKNGGHAEYIILREDLLVPIPKIEPKYALVEPLAVCVHALERIKISQSDRILISGYGCIGKLCGLVLKTKGFHFEICDPRYTSALEYGDFDIILECSGKVLSQYLEMKGATVLVFGFDYDKIDPALLPANEVSLVGTLGSTKKDFTEAVEIMSTIEPDFFEIMPLSSFSDGLKKSANGQKVVFNNKE